MDFLELFLRDTCFIFFFNFDSVSRLYNLCLLINMLFFLAKSGHRIQSKKTFWKNVIPFTHYWSYPHLWNKMILGQQLLKEASFENNILFSVFPKYCIPSCEGTIVMRNLFLIKRPFRQYAHCVSQLYK